ncbi:MAG: RdgB/HAM1 family non-canonical purine NTP pyrophosphatase [Candidatus Hydrogenedentes bacterium]|nr:RdgB/HAM1 family non-canonical purine NTP pyrophosphatase [Candidatus Hydrogenedentota bacterium]
MPETLLLGTKNEHKVAELAELLADLPWQVKGLNAFPPIPEPREDGMTFEENALLKAVYYQKASGLTCVADDSGIVVDALDAAPGVYSARYAGEGCTDAENNEKLLAELGGVPEPARTARFICCAAIAHVDGSTHSETGAVEGHIALQPRGFAGFGYDPLFIPEGYDQTFAELGASVKQRISHRARALGKLRVYLVSLHEGSSSNR